VLPHFWPRTGRVDIDVNCREWNLVEGTTRRHNLDLGRVKSPSFSPFWMGGDVTRGYVGTDIADV
jgi:hypothetical protein